MLQRLFYVKLDERSSIHYPRSTIHHPRQESFTKKCQASNGVLLPYKVIVPADYSQNRPVIVPVITHVKRVSHMLSVNHIC